MGRLTRNLAIAAVAACVAAVALAPGAAFAASKITLKSGAAAPSTVYAGHSYKLKVPGEMVKWSTSNRKVATVGVTTGKLVVRAPGKVAITAKAKKSGKKVATKTFKVLQRSTSVSASPDVIDLKAVGDTATITATKSPSTSTDVVRFIGSDKAVATVYANSGKLVAKGNGTCIVSVISKATKATSDNVKANKVCYVTVHVGPYLTAVEHDGVRVFAAVKNAPDGLNVSDFTLVNEETQMSYPIASVEQDGDQIALTTFSRLEEDRSFKLSYGEGSMSFTAAYPEVDAVKLTPGNVIAGIETPVKMKLVTAKGSVIAESDLSGSGLNGEYGTGYAASVKLASGSCSFNAAESAVYLPEVGDTAIVEVIRRTGKYDDAGQEIGVEKWKAIVTAREPNASETGLSEPALSVSCNDSGATATITAAFAKELQRNLKASDFVLRPKGGGDDIALSSASVFGKTRLNLTVASSALSDGRTYELCSVKEPFAKTLGEFSFAKYVYVAPTPDYGGELVPPDKGETQPEEHPREEGPLID